MPLTLLQTLPDSKRYLHFCDTEGNKACKEVVKAFIYFFCGKRALKKVIYVLNSYFCFLTGCYLFATCGSAAALAEIWTITIMAYDRCRIICAPSKTVSLDDVQVRYVFLCAMSLPLALLRI